MKKFKVKGYVKVIKPYHNIPLNATGIVRVINKKYHPPIGIEFFSHLKWVRSSPLHNLNGAIKTRKGYFLPSENLKIVPNISTLKTLERIRKMILEQIK